VATFTCEAEYIALALATKQWIWLMKAIKDLNVPVPNTAMFCENKAAIDIAYNHKIGD
jgi:aminoglycoside phosphotransferase (APT) family kinase protein